MNSNLSRLPLAATLAATLWAYTAAAGAAIVAFEDFDGGAINLISSSVPTLDGGGGDTHAVGATEAWPTTGGTPFSLADNSVGDVGDTTAFPNDTEGVFGVNSDFSNKFLGISDSTEFGDVVATWTFDISGASGLGLSIGMGSMEGSNFSYSDDTLLTFTASIDGGPVQTVFDVTPSAAGDGFTYRALDNGLEVVANDNALEASGDQPVTKLLAETGLPADNTFLDKTPADGPAAGMLDNFITSVDGTGSELVLTLTSNIPFEAVAIDNIAVTAIPEPGSLGLAIVGVLALGGFLRQK